MIVATVLAATEERGTELPVSPWFIGGGAFALLLLLLVITLSFGKDR
jgi:hypothetical protein